LDYRANECCGDDHRTLSRVNGARAATANAFVAAKACGDAMSEFLGQQASVEALQAYLLAYVQSRTEDERLAFATRLESDEGFMATALQLLHSTHDAMVACLRVADGETPGRIARLVESPDLFDTDLASVVCCTLAKFSPAIVMDLEPEDAARARLRLADLSVKVQVRTQAIKLH
jgi:hypothetical protein